MTEGKYRKQCFAFLGGATVTLVLALVFVLVIPLFILNEYFPMEYTKGVVIISMGLSVFVGAVVAGVLNGNSYGGRAIVMGVTYYIPIIFISVFVYDGLTVFNLYGILASLAGSVLAWCLINKPKKRRIKGRKRGGNG